VPHNAKLAQLMILVSLVLMTERMLHQKDVHAKSVNMKTKTSLANHATVMFVTNVKIHQPIVLFVMF
jgi:hypothetical protein